MSARSRPSYASRRCGDLVAAGLREVAPLGDEDAGSLRVDRDDLDVRLDERREPIHRVAGRALGKRGVGGRLERRRRPIDDRPEEVLLGGHVGVEAGALHVERSGDVADARRRVAVGVEQLSGDRVDRPPPAAGLDRQASPPT